MNGLTYNGTAEPVSRDHILSHEWREGKIHFPRSADNEQDWQPYPVDPNSTESTDHTLAANREHGNFGELVFFLPLYI